MRRLFRMEKVSKRKVINHIKKHGFWNGRIARNDIPEWKVCCEIAGFEVSLNSIEELNGLTDNLKTVNFFQNVFVLN
jgi:hypothetical protein